MTAKRGLIASACFFLLFAGAVFGAGEYLSKPQRLVESRLIHHFPAHDRRILQLR